ncbi:hypothetical protein [Pedobacter sp. Hv1]|uniref:hypothetical protein n=1 Tax=Pedobacter sp. Hv1 TaxID=1740090 RepID=UPI0006D8C792|nr:hypothetical protein [Pedobacter sp. Hv1]KQB99547.1 hypothetical protein AQF98_18495 [Pedobacter sp. Hv1]
MTQEIQELIEKIGQSTIYNIPVNNWDKVVVEFVGLSTYNELVANYFVNEVKGRSFDPNYPGTPPLERVHRKFVKLRQKMYALAPEKGAWYSVRMEINADGDFTLNYNYDERPDFEIEPDQVEYRIDLEKFPREKSLVPSWLTAIVNS